jgi:hypothetical protein
MSDPSQINVPINTALTSDMMLGLKPAAPRSRSYRLSVAPLNKNVFTSVDQIVFELPTGRAGTWLDQSQTYLKFSVQCQTNTAITDTNIMNGVNVENTAYSFFNRLDIYHSSNLLEQISEYGQLSNMLLDLQLSQSEKAGLSSLIGSNSNTVTYTAPLSAVSVYNSSLSGSVTALPIGPTRSLCVPGDRSGQSLLSTTTINTAAPFTFCLPVLSGVIGVNASKMLPLGKLSSPLRLEFYTAANDDAIYYGSAGAGATWQIINVELCCCYVELLDNFDNDRGTQYISTSTYRNSSTNLPAATSGEFTTLLPFRAASIKALYARFLPFVGAAQGGANAAYRKSASINPNISSYYFRVGSSIYPNKPVFLISGQQQSGAEGYAELIKSFHALSSTQGNTSLLYNQYNVCATARGGWAANFTPSTQLITPGTHNNSFAIGLELESFSNRNDTILSGVSTLNSQIYFNANLFTGTTAGGTNNYDYAVQFFSHMDMILVIDENGVMSAKF